MRKLGSHLAVLGAGMAMGLGSVAIAQSQVPGRSSSDAQIVNAVNRVGTRIDRLGLTVAETNARLDAVNGKLDIANKGIGGYTAIAPLNNVVDSVRNMCRQVAQYPSSC
jgi:hypothetical protein